MVLVVNRLISPGSEHTPAQRLETDYAPIGEGNAFGRSGSKQVGFGISFASSPKWSPTIGLLPTLKGKTPRSLVPFGYSRDQREGEGESLLGVVMSGSWPMATLSSEATQRFGEGAGGGGGFGKAPWGCLGQSSWGSGHGERGQPRPAPETGQGFLWKWAGGRFRRSGRRSGPRKMCWHFPARPSLPGERDCQGPGCLAQKEVFRKRKRFAGFERNNGIRAPIKNQRLFVENASFPPEASCLARCLLPVRRRKRKKWPSRKLGFSRRFRKSLKLMAAALGLEPRTPRSRVWCATNCTTRQ